MLQYAKIEDARLRNGKSEIVVTSEDSKLYEYIMSKRVKDTELRLDDGRRITALQRRKAYATIRDIALHTGYLPEEASPSSREPARQGMSQDSGSTMMSILSSH